MRIHTLQHVPFEGLGALADAFTQRGYKLDTTHLYLGQHLPALTDFDWLVVMGGPMGVNDEAHYLWLAEEKQLIKKAIAAGKRVLGICLGAQLIAQVMGAEVSAGAHREIGWHRVYPHPNARTPLAKLFADSPQVFHWHSDTFATPTGATTLALSDACANQAFAFNNHVVGLQFHVETTPESARALIKHCANELGAGRWVQDRAAILAKPERFVHLNQLMDQLVEQMAAPITS